MPLNKGTKSNYSSSNKTQTPMGSPYGAVTDVQNCNIRVSEFKL